MVSVVTAFYQTDTVAVSVLFTGITISMKADPSTILADGQSSTKVTAQLKETRRNVVISNEAVRFETTAGTLLDGEVRTDETGSAEATLVSQNAPGSAQVSVYFGPILSRSVTVEFRESIAGFIKVTANPETILADFP